MSVETYLRQNKESIQQECQAIANDSSKAIITLKKNGENYVRKIGTVEEFIASVPDTDFFKAMRQGVRNAVVNKVIPIVVFENKEAKLISFPDDFKYEK